MVFIISSFHAALFILTLRVTVARIHQQHQMLNDELHSEGALAENHASRQNVHQRHRKHIGPERARILRIQACTHEMKPFQLDTMLFFPHVLKFCASVDTDRGPSLLIRDHRKVAFLQPSVSLTFRQVGSIQRCQIEYLGYAGEYRFAPDFGYYLSCQKSISKHINWLYESESRASREYYAHAENGTTMGTLNGPIELAMPNLAERFNPNCPIQSLPITSKELSACELESDRWHELVFRSSIRYQLPGDNDYTRWANYSTTFIFKPERYVELNGTEIGWLQRMLNVKLTLKNGCSLVRYLLKLDEQWPDSLPISITIDYQVRNNTDIKFMRHLTNGTLESWFSGIFPILISADSQQTHELCIRFSWSRSANRYRLCKAFFYGRPTLPCSAEFESSGTTAICIRTMAILFGLFVLHFVYYTFNS